MNILVSGVLAPVVKSLTDFAIDKIRIAREKDAKKR